MPHFNHQSKCQIFFILVFDNLIFNILELTIKGPFKYYVSTVGGPGGLRFAYF